MEEQIKTKSYTSLASDPKCTLKKLLITENTIISKK